MLDSDSNYTFRLVNAFSINKFNSFYLARSSWVSYGSINGSIELFLSLSGPSLWPDSPNKGSGSIKLLYWSKTNSLARRGLSRDLSSSEKKLPHFFDYVFWGASCELTSDNRRY